ncbi:uncharacterized protein LOC121506449 [Cheilinus undulatus]|uniref:uncharacterized protein LOC121506449 n=1 Tax=Cheilinus undulatus TaxID=241271 RepID=UPI001BD42880|nr:uncharacterized protein LOC121506449 [Cheilinus undulatus]
MANWTLFIVLILPAMVCLDSKGTQEETFGRERGVLSVCFNDTMNNIMLIVCKIRTERRMGQNCNLLYRDGQKFEDKCDSRFRLLKKDETVFLKWKDLTPEDHGNITCECFHSDGTFTLELSVRFNGFQASENEQPSSEKPEQFFPFIGRISVIVITAAILGLVYRRLHHRVCSRSAASGSTQETPKPVDGADREDPYSSLQQPTSDLYQTITPAHQQNTSEALP